MTAGRSRRTSRRRFLALAAAAFGVTTAGRATPVAAIGPLASWSSCACGAPARGAARRLFENRIGWAYTVRASTRRAQMLADLRRMRDLGCNTLYLGHSSAANTDPEAFEPGLAPSVWFAIAAATPEADHARQIVGFMGDALDAAREVGLDVVLPIGYQIAMGDEWNAAYPDELRLDRDGRPMIHWGSLYTASPYSEKYRRDIREYYGWINQTFVAPSPHVVAVNLADEPMGTDFSPRAMAAFEARYGTPFDQATSFEQGDFLAGVIPDYAAWSATAWSDVSPDVRSMMTFHIQRDAPFVPDIERIFSQSPPSFIVSADTHLDDGPVDRALTPENTRLLYGMVRTLGWLSRVYDHPLMLWTSANAWGLKTTGGVREALLNLDIVHDATKQAGGRIGMLMAWGWNIYKQGVYDDRGNFPVDKDQFITAVSQALAARRERLSVSTDSRPERVYYVPATRLYPAIGEQRVDHLATGIVDLTPIDFEHQNAVYLTDGRALEETRRLGIPITVI